MGTSDWVSLGAAAAGAFLGAISAFALEAIRRRRQERAERHAALMQAQFVLAMQLNTLVNVRHQYLDGVEADPERFMKLPPLHGNQADLRVDSASIAFLASEDQVEVLQTLHMAQDAYLTAMHVIEVRNAMVQDVYSSGTPVSEFDFGTGVGAVSVDVRKARVLKGATDGLYASVDGGVELERKAVRLLGEASKRLYPKLPIVSVEDAIQSDAV